MVRSLSGSWSSWEELILQVPPCWILLFHRTWLVRDLCYDLRYNHARGFMLADLPIENLGVTLCSLLASPNGR